MIKIYDLWLPQSFGGWELQCLIMIMRWGDTEKYLNLLLSGNNKDVGNKQQNEQQKWGQFLKIGDSLGK